MWRNGNAIDLTIDSKFGMLYEYHIPNNWFEKETNAKILPRWIGYGNLNKEYSFIAHVPSGVKNIIIDKSNRLADSYMINNRLNGNVDFSRLRCEKIFQSEKIRT